MKACLVCGKKAAVQFKNQPASTFCGENCARFHFIGGKRGRGVTEDARQAAKRLVDTALATNDLNCIITGPAMEKATLFLGSKGWGERDNEQPNLVGNADFYDILRHIAETQFDDDSSIHKIDFYNTSSGGIMINDIEIISKEDLINLFYYLWNTGRYRWPKPLQTEKRNFFDDD